MRQMLLDSVCLKEAGERDSTHPPVMSPPEPEPELVPSRAWRFFSASVYCTWIGIPSNLVPESVSAFCTVSRSTNST